MSENKGNMVPVDPDMIEETAIEPAAQVKESAIAEADTITATNAVISFMEKTTSNKSFVLSVKKSFATD